MLTVYLIFVCVHVASHPYLESSSWSLNCITQTDLLSESKVNSLAMKIN